MERKRCGQVCDQNRCLIFGRAKINEKFQSIWMTNLDCRQKGTTLFLSIWLGLCSPLFFFWCVFIFAPSGSPTTRVFRVDSANSDTIVTNQGRPLFLFLLNSKPALNLFSQSNFLGRFIISPAVSGIGNCCTKVYNHQWLLLPQGLNAKGLLHLWNDKNNSLETVTVLVRSNPLQHFANQNFHPNNRSLALFWVAKSSNLSKPRKLYRPNWIQLHSTVLNITLTRVRLFLFSYLISFMRFT